jgi:hypothetical protein
LPWASIILFIHVHSNATSFDPVRNRDESPLQAPISEIDDSTSLRSHLKLVTDGQKSQGDDLTEHRAQVEPHQITRIELAFEDGILQVIAPIPQGFKNLAEPLVIPNVVGDQIDGSHDRTVGNGRGEK